MSSKQKLPITRECQPYLNHVAYFKKYAISGSKTWCVCECVYAVAPRNSLTAAARMQSLSSAECSQVLPRRRAGC